MSQGISLRAAGHATSLFFAITYLLCIAFELIFPAHGLYRAWLGLLPNFVWLTWESFIVGLVESYGYGWFLALIWVPLYNAFLLGIRRGD